MLERRVPIPRGESPWLPLVRYFEERRRRLAAIYIALCAALFAVLVDPEILPIRDAGGWGDGMGYLAPLIIIVFLLTQVAFVLGGGRIRLGPRRPSPLWGSIAIASALFAILTVAFVTTFLEFGDRLGGHGSVRIIGLRHLGVKGLLGTTQFTHTPTIILGAWAAWFLVVYFYTRSATSHEGTLQRLALGVLAGSWVEFIVALAVHAVLRRGRGRECPFELGTWVSISFAAPILVWAIGPSIVLLFLNHAKQNRDSPHALLRILVRKYDR